MLLTCGQMTILSCIFNMLETLLMSGNFAKQADEVIVDEFNNNNSRVKLDDLSIHKLA